MYTAQDYSHLLGTQGFSDELLKNHFKLYEGYVANTNKVADLLAKMRTEGKADAPEYAELKRRFGWEFNGMRLHEYYFGNMSSMPITLESEGALMKKVTESFGSYDAWKDDFIATGKMRGIGWVVLCSDEISGSMFNVWINEHDLGHLAGVKPLLVMDVFEHAFMLDYGLNRAGYIESFMSAINWEEVEKRFETK